MPSTTDEEVKKGLFVLFKGESGMGKSVGALSFPNAYVFDFDRKMPTIAKKHFPGVKIDYDYFADIFTASDKIGMLYNSCPYETLIIDSILSVSNTCLSSIATVKGDETIKMLQSLRGKKNQTIELMSVDYYNGETRFFYYLIDILKEMWSRPGKPYHIIFIAHILTVDSAPDLKTKIVTRTRSIVTAGRKVAAYIPSQFDEVWTFGYKPPDLGAIDSTVRRIVTTDASGEDISKTAYSLPVTIDFTKKSLFAELQKYITFPSDEKNLNNLLVPTS